MSPPTVSTETFSGVLGNRASLWLLERALQTGGLSHAYLLHGPSGVGKRTVALRFGAALVSSNAGAEDRARRGLHPDLTEVEPEGAFTTIGQVREVMRLAAGRPFEGVRRVFILEADTLNPPAANALLKTLESPEGETVFLLLAATREAVLPTISSRAQGVRFDPVPEDEVAGFLRERSVDNPDLAASLGRGSVGLSLRYAGEPELAGLREAVLGAAFSYGRDFEDRSQSTASILARAEAVGEAREADFLEGFEEPDRRAKEAASRAGRAARDGAVGEALDLLALAYRDAAAVAAGAQDLVVNTDRVQEIQRHTTENPESDWAGAALEAQEARSGLVYNVSPEAILEAALSKARRRILRSSLAS